MRRIKISNQILTVLFWGLFSVLFSILTALFSIANADDSLCAEVKIEINQELTLERQAFDAHMRINNGLSHITLEDVVVEVTFLDEAENPVLASSDPDNTTAVFFIQEDSIGMGDNGNGTWQIDNVGPSSSRDLHWMIIPAIGASNGHSSGTLYYVGAKLMYSIGGEDHVTKVSPDYIFVKPMPELTLDYFLTKDVFGDDAFTPEIEPSVPFTLGVRIKNTGAGTAHGLKIDSAQPKIVENEQGLLIGFEIESCEVDGNRTSSSLLIDFQDISPDTASVGKWVMTCSLSGEFTEFDADFSHSDELGGELTSLIDQVETHFLIRDVLCDLPGRDVIDDFLTDDPGGLRVFESDGTDTAVLNQTWGVSFQLDYQSGSETRHTLSMPESQGFVYVEINDPHAGHSGIKSAVRSDGKVIKAQNIWLSKTRNQDNSWNYFINLFDVNTTGMYTIIFDENATIPQAPVLQYIPDKLGAEGQQLSFIVEATDADGDTPLLSAIPLPAGADFTDGQNGSGMFEWTPVTGQDGEYAILLIASDGILEDSQRVTLTICPSTDTDCDGMADAWELQHFGDLSRDGTGDYDGDGIPDLEEYLMGTNPSQIDHAPEAPEIVAPADQGRVPVFSPELVIANSIDPDGDSLTYEFEVYADPEFKVIVADNLNVPETTPNTIWIVDTPLQENSHYYWRVRATDGYAYSLWVYGKFFVNSQNDPPGDFYISYPKEGYSVDTLTPFLEITSSTDPDDEMSVYSFEVYTDDSMTQLLTSVSGITSDILDGEDGTVSWKIDTVLNDESEYFWKAVAVDEEGEMFEVSSSFYVQTRNHAPSSPEIVLPISGTEISMPDVTLEAANSIDPDGDILSYYFELDTRSTFDSPEKQISTGMPEQTDVTQWQVAALSDNNRYHWRVKACDGSAQSPWAYGDFFVNTANDNPMSAVVKNPGDNAWVDTLTPSLTVISGADPDNDARTFQYKVYQDRGLTVPVVQDMSAYNEFSVSEPLTDNTRYYWRARVQDEHGGLGEWTEVSSFFVKDDGDNDPPRMDIIEPSQDLYTNRDSILITWEDQDPDSNAGISFFYDTVEQGENGILIIEGIPENDEGSHGIYEWDVSELEGTFYVYAIIVDEVSSQTVHAIGKIVIDRTPPIITATPEQGTYGTVQSVSFSADEESDIFYTIDGTNPTIQSPLYDASIEISEKITLNTIGVDKAGNQSAVYTFDYMIEEDIILTVENQTGVGMSGLRAYAFTEAGSYTGKSAVTDDQGSAHFNPNDFQQGSYKFRIDFLGHQFWTDPVSLPDQVQSDLIIEMESVDVNVSTTAGVAQEVNVYLFTESGSYLSVNGQTNETGSVTFELPVGASFKLRADILGNQYFSDIATITGGVANTVVIDAGGGTFKVFLEEDVQTPMEGINIYLFSETGSYLSLHQITDQTGAAEFSVPEGIFKVRADYLGYQFWSADTLIEQDTQIDLTIPHNDIAVWVKGSFQATDEPIEAVKVYLFKPSGSYMNVSETTGENGYVWFHLPEQAYKVRADYLGQQFWSEDFTAQNAEVVIPMADTQITVTGNGQSIEGVNVYLFSMTGSYLSRHQTTDSQGNAFFHLPAESYKFRADYQGSQYWSAEESLLADIMNPVEISTGGGTFELTVLKNETDPLVGAICYLFSGSEAYLNLSGTTSSDGKVTFNVADGDYKIRVDHLGYQFWTDIYNVPSVLSDTFTILHQDVTITLSGMFQGVPEPVEGIRIYLFTAMDSYLSQYQDTSSQGEVVFSLPDQPYKVRADWLGHQFWSDEINAQDTPILIPMADAQITVTSAGSPISAIPVYVFSKTGSYLNLNQTTGANGQVLFRLPVETYKFRADYQGSQYWTGEETLSPDQINPIEINTGGGRLSLTVLQNETEPLVGVKCYVFSERGSYLNLNGTTSSEGLVTFELADGNYKIRVDYLGYQFWTNVYTIPDTLVEVLIIDTMDVTVSVQGFYLMEVPVEGLKVYLFKPSGSYLSQNRTTDANGQAVFRLPNQPYTIRVDYLGSQFWSDPFQFEDTTVTINQGLANIHAHRSGIDLEGARVYLFNESGSYLNWYENTDPFGISEFLLPDRSYKFRVDEGGDQIYSPVVEIQAGQIHDLEINLDE